MSRLCNGLAGMTYNTPKTLYMIYYRCSTTGHLVYQYHNLLMHLFLFWRDMAWGEDFDLSKTPHQNAHFGPMSVQNPHSGTNRHYSVFILIVILPIKIPIRDKKKKKKEKKKRSKFPLRRRVKNKFGMI